MSVRVAWNKNITKFRSKPCLCGCGTFLKVHKYFKKEGQGFSYIVNSFVKGHKKRGAPGFNPEIHNSRLCACGCGELTKKFRGGFNRFIKKHENIGRTPWNKGKSFSLESRQKMSIARLGKEPANKVRIDFEKLYKFCVQEKKSASAVSKELNVSLDVVKNRLRELRWSRSTKESCSEPLFRERMRGVRIKTLSSPQAMETPNKLEKLVYNSLDNLGVVYKKQTPLFGKFVVDIFFPQALLVVEIFGRYWHEMSVNKKKDYSKKRYLEKCGYKVEELWDDEIRRHGADVLLGEILRKYNLV